MKTVYRNVSGILIILLIALGKTAIAQVSTGYSFSSASGTYTAISGTTFVTGAAWDDDTITVNLPFTFTYNNIAFTQVSINTNGLLSFSYFPDIYNVCGLQSTAPVTPFNTIAGYGTDLEAAAASSNIQYTTIGTAPNRQFVVQWTNVDHYNAGAHTNHLNFQMSLSETSNVIQLIWGTVTMASTWGANTCTDAVTESGSVGLMGNTTSDLNIRKITNGTDTWAASIAGAALSDVCNISPTNTPALGLTYSWTPIPPSPMVYTSATTVLLNNGQLDGRNSPNTILQVQVVTSGSLNPFDVTSLSFSTAGSTNSILDITSAKVYYTGYSNVFSTANQFGSTVVSPNGAYTVNGTATLFSGTNYFWVEYEVSSNAGIGDSLSGCCTQIMGNGSMGTQLPAITCPSGFQQITEIGHWVPLANHAPHGNGETLLLLSDGTLLAHTFSGGTLGYGSVFDRLTPDSTGSYINGTWSSIAPMVRERLAFSSAILKDGRVYCAGGEYGTDGAQAGYHGEVYNPLTNTWASISGTSASWIFSDGNCKILDNGNILQAGYPSGSRGIKVFNPTTMAYTTGAMTTGSNNESMWVKLPDNTILYVNTGTQVSERYHPATNTWTADANCPVSLYDPFGLECGPGWLLPNGKVFFIGGTGHTATYTPSGTVTNGTWVTGPDVPNGRGMPDAPGGMMINGKILIAVSAIPTATVEFASPTYFYEYDYVSNSFTEVNAPGGGLSVAQISQSAAMLDLPDGTVLYASDDVNSSQYYVYIPSGTPQASWKPVINSVTPITCSTFMLTGIQFNGISEGAAFGDEGENDSNFPIVRMTYSTGRVYYARSYNWNSTGVQRGNNADTTYFTPDATVPAGSYSLSVIANGIASDTVALVYMVPPTTANAGSNQNLCDVSATNLNGNPPTIGTGLWTLVSGSGVISNPASPTSGVTGLGVGANVFQWTISYGSCAPSTSQVTITNDIPVVPVITPAGSLFTSSASNTYQWFTGGAPIGGATSITYHVTVTGYYLVCTTDLAGCSACSDSVFVDVTGIGSLSASSNYFNVFPNPSRENFEIIFASAKSSKVTFSITDELGRIVYSTALISLPGENKIKVNSENFEKGVYFVEMLTDENKANIKLIIE